ncbi:MAG: 3-beta hydroxysteroid dehydrogenase [Deltaproteobacteria bacterium]|nr:MAG: 3-beta hydroxysteroid dehydrogenase [Deltaproteobacteria bacterium]
MAELKKALITGGGGFIGRKIVGQLLARGVDCLVIGRHNYPELERLGVKCLIGNICDNDFVLKICSGVDTVFHTAAIAGMWGKWDDYYAVNFLGTKNIIAACLKNQVKSLVYTSTPSVVFNGQDICGGDENMPYAENFLCHYAKSKTMAEKAVLSAVKENGLNACAVRPHLVYGPGDPHLVPRLLDRGRKRKLKIVGSGDNLVDISYIDNVAHLHILAAASLLSDGRAKGQAYFIGDEEPVKLWDWINSLFEQTGLARIEKMVPAKAAYAASGLIELLYKGLNLAKEPPMTRFVAEQLSKSHYFSHQKAREELGYQPLVNPAQAMENLLIWIRENDI